MFKMFTFSSEFAKFLIVELKVCADLNSPRLEVLWMIFAMRALSIRPISINALSAI